MTIRINKPWLFAVAGLLAAALSGCGGGTAALPETPLEFGGIVDVESPDDPIYAKNNADTLENLLPKSANEFTPLTAVIKKTWGSGEDRGVTKSDGVAYIKSITGDDAGGFSVTFVVEGTKSVVQFHGNDDYDLDDTNFHKTVDGVNYEFWSYTDSFDEAPRNDGGPARDYFDVNGWWLESDTESYAYQGFSTYGVETDPANLPRGSATYVGWIYADVFEGSDPASRTSRTRVWSVLRLDTDFDRGKIAGKTDDLQVRFPEPDQAADDTRYRALKGNSIVISDGQIVKGKFAADWMGKDVNVVDKTIGGADGSIHGFKGKIVGAFYGPAAEEVGGVLNGNRATFTSAEGETVPEHIVLGGFSAER